MRRGWIHKTQLVWGFQYSLLWMDRFQSLDQCKSSRGLGDLCGTTAWIGWIGIGWTPGSMCCQQHCWSQKLAGIKRPGTGTSGWGSLLCERKWWVWGLPDLASKGGWEVVTNHPSIHACIFLKHSTMCFHRHYCLYKTRVLLTLKPFDLESDGLLHAVWSQRHLNQLMTPFWTMKIPFAQWILAALSGVILDLSGGSS